MFVELPELVAHSDRAAVIARPATTAPPRLTSTLHAGVVADELDRIAVRIRDEERPPVEKGELLRRHAQAQALELAPARIVVVEVDDEREMVERRRLRRNRGAAVEQDERLRMPFHAFGDLKEDVIVALAPHLEAGDVAVEGPHCREVEDTQGKLAEHRNSWWDDLARGWLVRPTHGRAR